MMENPLLRPPFKHLEEISQVHRLTRKIDGWLTELEGAGLYTAAKYGPGEGKIVEIGSFKGKSTIWLAVGSKSAGREHVYAVDHHQGSPEHRSGGEFFSHMPSEGTTERIFRANLVHAGVEDWVVPVIRPSHDAFLQWEDSIRLLFIDGNHDYREVKRDFLDWEKHVVAGGIVAFHDVDQWDGTTKILGGPTRVVYEDVPMLGLYSPPTFINHLALVSKQRLSLLETNG